VPIRVTSRGPDPVGPKPFSQEWVASPPEASATRDRRSLGAAPREGLLAALLVLLIVALTVPWRGGIEPANGPNTDQALTMVDAPTPIVQDAPTETSTQAEEALQETPDTDAGANNAADSALTPTVESVADEPTPTTAVAAASMEGALFPEYRVLSYYGFPGVPEMGILGAYEQPELLEILRDQAAEYEAADPDRPVALAFEVITSVAQQWQGDDGDHLAYIGRDQLQEYIDFTAENDLLLILDMQFGRRTVQQEIDAVREFLAYPHVHLALDPEFAVDEGEVPGTVIGQIDAADVQYALEEMVKISEENNIPPKMLIVHQFTESSITNREAIVPVPGVQFVLEIDGFGTPDAKRSTYAVLTQGDPAEYYGFKLWYNQQDDPLMTPAEVLSLDPIPDLVIYQ
jgi:hypothetical protein